MGGIGTRFLLRPIEKERIRGVAPIKHQLSVKEPFTTSHFLILSISPDPGEVLPHDSFMVPCSFLVTEALKLYGMASGLTWP